MNCLFLLGSACKFNAASGGEYEEGKCLQYHAWAVHDGDVASVAATPEAETDVLFRRDVGRFHHLCKALDVFLHHRREALLHVGQGDHRIQFGVALVDDGPRRARGADTPNPTRAVIKAIGAVDSPLR